VSRLQGRRKTIDLPRRAYVLGIRTWSPAVVVGEVDSGPVLMSHGDCVWPRGRRLEARCAAVEDGGEDGGMIAHDSPPPLDASECRCGIYAVSHLEVPRMVPAPPMDLTPWDDDGGSGYGDLAEVVFGVVTLNFRVSERRGWWRRLGSPAAVAGWPDDLPNTVYGYVALWGRVRTAFEGDLREWRGQFAYPQAFVADPLSYGGRPWRRVLEQLARAYGVPLLEDWIWPTGVRT